MKKSKPAEHIYHRMSIHFESLEAAKINITKFHDEVAALREKYKIPDVVLITKVGAMTESGKCGDYITHMCLGYSLNHLPMVAFTNGFLKKENDEMMGGLLNGNADTIGSMV